MSQVNQPSDLAVLSNIHVTVRSLLEALAEAAIFVDAQGTIVLVNRRAEEMFGYRRDEVVGRSLGILLPQRFAKAHARRVSDYFKTPRTRPMGQGFDLTARRQDGLEFPVEVSLCYMDTEAGPLSLALVTDITRRKRAEETLKQRNQELDAFAHIIAHDLQASVSTIVGFSEVLLEDLEALSTQELRDHLGVMFHSGQKLSHIIQELLLFARLRQEEVTMAPLDMASIVDEALARLGDEIQDTAAEIILPDSYPTAMGRSSWVEEVWFNYISNALKYGGQPPRVEIGGDMQDDGWVKFWVKDNGPGLTQEEQARLFHTFTRLDPSRGEGQGMGLSIVQRIVQKLDGHTGVDSTPGQGSTFGFVLRQAE